MREVVLYLAVSLDGYLADRAGGVGWLSGPDGAWEGVENSYPEFLRGVDTVVMGWNTYRQVAEELAPGGVALPGFDQLCGDPPDAAAQRGGHLYP